MPDKKKPEDMTFEAAASRLNEIVKSLEDGKAPLSDTLGLFEEGVALVRRCNAELDAAEQRITELTGEKGNADD